jgi:hypothetical protein
MPNIRDYTKRIATIKSSTRTVKKKNVPNPI